MKRALMVLALGQARDPRSFVRVNAGHAIRRTRFRDTVFHSVFARGTIVYTHTHTQGSFDERLLLFTRSHGGRHRGERWRVRWREYSSADEVTRYLKRVILSPFAFFLFLPLSPPFFSLSLFLSTEVPLSTFHSLDSATRVPSATVASASAAATPGRKPGIAGRPDTLLSSHWHFIYYPRLLQQTAASGQLSARSSSSPERLDGWMAGAISDA